MFLTLSSHSEIDRTGVSPYPLIGMLNSWQYRRTLGSASVRMLTFTPIALVRHSSHFAVRKVQSTAEALMAISTSLSARASPLA